MIPEEKCVLVPLEVTDEVRAFLLRALVAEARRWRVDGLRPPAEVRGFIDWLSAGLAGSKVASPCVGLEADLVNREAAARRVGVSQSTIKRAIAAGELAEHRVGRRSLIGVDDLAIFLAARRVEGRAS